MSKTARDQFFSFVNRIGILHFVVGGQPTSHSCSPFRKKDKHSPQREMYHLTFTQIHQDTRGMCCIFCGKKWVQHSESHLFSSSG